MSVYDDSNNILATWNFPPDIKWILTTCGFWTMDYNNGKLVSRFTPGSSYVYDRFTSEIYVRTFQCEPKPNVCDQEPSGNNVVVDDGDTIIIENGG